MKIPGKPYKADKNPKGEGHYDIYFNPDVYKDYTEGGKEGTLNVTAKNPSKSELKAAEFMQKKGHDVELRDPIAGGSLSRTSDLLVDGIPYDVYTPKTSNPDRIISAIRSKNSQANGIVLNLSESSVNLSDLGDVLKRVQGAGGTNINDIVILK